MRKKLDITSYGILFIGTILFCLVCYTTPGIWWTAIGVLPALIWFAYQATPEPDPVIEYALPDANGVQVITSIMLTDNNLASAVLHVFPEYLQVTSNFQTVRVEMNQLTQIEMQDLSGSNGPLSGFALVYQVGRKEQMLMFAAQVSPWVTKGIVKLLLETYDAYYQGTTVPPLPYREVSNPNKAGMVHRTDSVINKAVGDLN